MKHFLHFTDLSLSLSFVTKVMGMLTFSTLSNVCVSQICVMNIEKRITNLEKRITNIEK